MPLLDLLRPVSDEELRVLSERNPGWQFERLADGRLIVSPTGGQSGRIRAAVLAGVASIEHGTYASDRTLQIMKEKGTLCG